MAGKLVHAVTRMPIWALCALVVALEGFVVLVVCGQAAAPPLGGDAGPYDLLARNLLHGHGFSESVAAPYQPNVIRAPGYPAILAALKAIGAGSQVGIRIAQLTMLAATATVVGHVGATLRGPRAGRVAALLCATYLPLVWLTTWEMAEVAGALTVAVVVALVLRAQRRPGLALGAWALAGLGFAAMSYVRPSLLPAAGLVAAAVAAGGTGGRRSARRWAPALAFLAALGIAIAPWTARNWSLIHQVVPLAAGSGGSMYASAAQYDGTLSFSFGSADWVRWKEVERRTSRPYRRHGFTPADQVAWMRDFAAQAPWGSVTAGDVARRLPARMAALWGPADSTPMAGTWSDTARRLGLAQYALLLALVVAGLAWGRRRLLAEWPVWIFAAYLTALHLVAHVELRYTLPARPLLAVYAALALAQLARSRSRSRTPGRPARQRWWPLRPATSPRR